MAENKAGENQQQQPVNGQLGLRKTAKSSFKIDFAALYTALILNWKWFVLSIIVCVGAAYMYLRYTTPTYRSVAKLQVNDNSASAGRSNATFNSLSSGRVSMSSGIDNEMEILTTHSLAAQVVRDLRLYIEYYSVGKMKDVLLYGNEPITVGIDGPHLEKLQGAINLQIERNGNKYHVTGNGIDRTFSTLPQTVTTNEGILSFSQKNPTPMTDGQVIKVNIVSPLTAAYKFVSELSVNASGRTTNIVLMSMVDQSQQRASDFLQQLAVCYNRQANDEKNEVAMRTEQFINGRIQKINAELGSTEGAIESYKKSKGMVELKVNATNAFNSANEAEKNLNDANTQVALLEEVRSVINSTRNSYQLLPVNVGISDASINSLINDYNSVVQKRSLLLQSASEQSPTVVPLTNQLDQLQNAIGHAINNTMRNLDIKRNAIASQYGKYQGEVGESPEQERTLTQIGRQQEVKSGLYIMLLQKREENSISLAATADKGKLIDGPAAAGKVSPDNKMVMMSGFGIGIAIPIVFLFILQLFHYRIEGHDDVEKLTSLPILADVAVASESNKKNGEVVVKENRNDVMEEIFRSVRTNLIFTLRGDQKVILCTSNSSGEGKSFITSNLAMSFALLGKKVLLLGADIRKPRLGHIFNIKNDHNGLTNLLVNDKPTWEDIQVAIKPSGVNDNLDIILSGTIPPNPTELLARQSLVEIFKILREHYDYILVDSAPVGMVTDTLALGKVCDATIFVCRADFTPKAAFKFINSLVETNMLPNVSIVINGIDMSKKKYSYYYGYGRYGRYGRYANTRSAYGVYGSYRQNHYGNKEDKSVKV